MSRTRTYLPLARTLSQVCTPTPPPEASRGNFREVTDAQLEDSSEISNGRMPGTAHAPRQYRTLRTDGVG
eukprot:2754823-Rhodomonas_salina.1